jgi:hypothetical protein
VKGCGALASAALVDASASIAQVPPLSSGRTGTAVQCSVWIGGAAPLLGAPDGLPEAATANHHVSTATQAVDVRKQELVQHGGEQQPRQR